MAEVLRVGDLLDGYCGGSFQLGPDQVRVEAIGADWVVVRAIDTVDPGWSLPQLFTGRPEELLEYVGECWSCGEQGPACPHGERGDRG